MKIYTCLCKFLVFDCLHSKCRQMRQCAWTAGFPWVVIRSANATRVYCVSWRTAGCYRLCPPWSVFNSFLLFYACRGSFWLVTQSLKGGRIAWRAILSYRVTKLIIGTGDELLILLTEFLSVSYSTGLNNFFSSIWVFQENDYCLTLCGFWFCGFGCWMIHKTNFSQRKLPHKNNPQK